MSLAFATHHGLDIQQMDVKRTFLNGYIEEEICMEVHQGLHQKQRSSRLTCKLEKALYGLKQSSRQWYQCLDFFLIFNNILNNDENKNVYCCVC
jgi:hypothetical protein